MASSEPRPPKSELPKLQRYITTHTTDGRSVFSEAISEAPIFDVIGFALGYITSEFPVRMASDADIANYCSFLGGSKPGLVNKNGTVLRICDLAPDSITPMHRTLSLDYGIVVAGEVELVLESGETRLLKVGDIAVQRGTMHAWKVPSTKHWSRMIFILQEAEVLELGGKKLTEEYGGIDVPPSNT